MKITAPNRASRTYRQRIDAPPERVFPLLCPVREADWAAGWAPLAVMSVSGLVETDCVFVTPAEPVNAIWYVTRHEPADFFVEFVRITPEVTACRLSIRLAGDRDGCTADVTYTHTSLGPRGDEYVRAFTAAHYREFMQTWERELNHYLATGRMLGR
jgi:hypothetical protein